MTKQDVLQPAIQPDDKNPIIGKIDPACSNEEYWRYYSSIQWDNKELFCNTANGDWALFVDDKFNSKGHEGSIPPELTLEYIELNFSDAVDSFADIALIDRTAFTIEDESLTAKTSTGNYTWSVEDQEWFES